MDDVLAVLRAAGHPVDALAPAQLDVLRTLTPTEVDMLLSVKARLDAAADDVQGHALGAGIF